MKQFAIGATCGVSREPCRVHFIRVGDSLCVNDERQLPRAHTLRIEGVAGRRMLFAIAH